MTLGTNVTHALLFASVLFVPNLTLAQVTTVTVRVDGLSCPFCAYSLEKKIKAIEGTKEPVINVEQGIVTLAPVGDALIDFEGLREAVKKAGFTPREISVEGVGRLATIGERPTLVAEDGRQLFLLAPNDVLARLQTDTECIVTFRGTVAPRENGDDGTLRTLVLLSTSPRVKEDVN